MDVPSMSTAHRPIYLENVPGTSTAQPRVNLNSLECRNPFAIITFGLAKLPGNGKKELRPIIILFNTFELTVYNCIFA